MAAAPPPALIWIDPGGMTGMAFLMTGTFAADEYGYLSACEHLDSWCRLYRGTLHIGWEKFTILPSTHKLSPQPEAYEFPGVIRFLAARHGCRLLAPAQPSDRNMATPAELKALGWWVPGKDDAQSASLHLLAWLKRSKCLPPELAAKLARARADSV